MGHMVICCRLLNVWMYLKFSLKFIRHLVSQMVKSMPAMWETGVGSLHREDTLEKEMATHSSILAWKILWMEEPSRGSLGCKESDTSERLHFHFVCLLISVVFACNVNHSLICNFELCWVTKFVSLILMS